MAATTTTAATITMTTRLSKGALQGWVLLIRLPPTLPQVPTTLPPLRYNISCQQFTNLRQRFTSNTHSQKIQLFPIHTSNPLRWWIVQQWLDPQQYTPNEATTAVAGTAGYTHWVVSAAKDLAVTYSTGTLPWSSPWTTAIRTRPGGNDGDSLSWSTR